ncbi:hypothetical protein LCGC14_2440330 [marine sediment metagenome]|uniref:Helix-turn-helix domain-containing protein n=1 Tax=marine sediment metagenome TaxID=412755 RepID=A0A0F9C6M5_9ZZZZ
MTPDGPTASVIDVSRFFRVSTSTVRKWIRAGDIPHTKIGGVIRFNLAEVMAWADSVTKDGAA